MSRGFQFSNVVRTLSEPNFRDFTIGNCVSLIGTWTHRIAVGWLTWELTGSTTWLGVMAFADLFPAVVMAPFAGVAADRWDQLQVMKLAQAVGSALVAALSLCYFAGVLDIWVLFGFTLALGIVDAGVQPFRLAFISALVPKSQLNAAVAIRSVTFNSARFIGPAVAGVVIATVGVGWAFAVNAVSYVLFLGMLLRIRLPAEAPRPAVLGRGMWSEAIAGLRYAATAPGIRVIFGIMTLSCLMGRPLVELLPGWAAAAFSGDASDLAALTSAFGIGAVIGGVWLAGRPDPVGLTRIYLSCCAGLGLSLLVFATAPNTLVALPIALVCGLFMVTSGVCAQTLVQLNVEDGFRGRALSVYGLILRGGPAIGALLMGISAERFGLRLPLVVGALILLVPLAPAFRCLPKLADILESKFRGRSEPD